MSEEDKQNRKEYMKELLKKYRKDQSNNVLKKKTN